MAMVIVSGGKKYMEKVYILYEERENSQLCGIRGVWGEKEKAIAQMKKLILSNNLGSMSIVGVGFLRIPLHS